MDWWESMFWPQIQVVSPGIFLPWRFDLGVWEYLGDTAACRSHHAGGNWFPGWFNVPILQCATSHFLSIRGKLKWPWRSNDVWFTFLLSLVSLSLFFVFAQIFSRLYSALLMVPSFLLVLQYTFIVSIFTPVCPFSVGYVHTTKPSTHWIPPWVGMVWVFTIPVFRWGKGPVWSASCSPNDRYIHHLCAEKLIKHSRP